MWAWAAAGAGAGAANGGSLMTDSSSAARWPESNCGNSHRPKLFNASTAAEGRKRERLSQTRHR